MHIQIRLAERQGLFNHYQISPIQFYGMSMLDLIAQNTKNKDDDRTLRIGLLIAGQLDLKNAFPEIIPPKEVSDDDDLLPDEEAVIYKFTNASYDPKQVEEEMRAMAAAAAVGSSSFGQVIGRN